MISKTLEENLLLYEWLRVKIESLGGSVTCPTPAGRFAASFQGCRYSLTLEGLDEVIAKLPRYIAESWR